MTASVAGAVLLALAAPHAQAATALVHGTAAPAASGGAASKLLSSSEASARAKASDKPVLATSLTTPTREIAANPNGTFTMTISAAPVRVERHGAWVGLDATLHQNPNGTLSPAAVPGTLTLSGGGTGPLAVMTAGGQQLSVTLSGSLPKPTVAGDTATYADVLPATDLVVTATSQGGFSDVFVIRTPAAAHNPRLAALMNARVSGSRDLTLRTDAAGEFTAAGPDGRDVFTAPVAAAWDSASADISGAPAARATQTTGPRHLIPTGIHTPLASTLASPGRYAHQAGLDAAFRDGTLALTVPTDLANVPTSDFPLYLDPNYGPVISNFATVSDGFKNQPYLNGSGTQGYMQVGYNGPLEGCNPCFNARSFVTLNLSGLPSNAQDISAQVNFWNSWSASCTAEELDLWSTGPISTSQSNPTTWNNQPKWNSEITPSQVVSKGWVNSSGSSPCPAGPIGWDISTPVKNVVSAHGTTLTLGLRIPASQESTGSSPNDDNWKQLNGNNTNQSVTTASVTYNVKPNTPSKLYTSPFVNCSATSPTPLGDTGITLYAPVSTPTNASLTTTFDFYKTSAPSVNLLTKANGIISDVYIGASGQPAVMVLPEAFIKAQAGTTSPTTFAWSVTTSDGITSDPSAACTFVIDESRPGSPTVNPTPTASLPTGSRDCPLNPVPAGTTLPPIGTSCAFDFGAPNGTAISGYIYQVNEAQPVEVPATGDITVTVKLPGIINTLTVSALSASGNVGSATPVWFDGSNFNPPETDGDLTADATPDLIVPGGASGAFPPGLWLAPAQRNGTVDSYPTNVGAYGLFNTAPTPTDWNGTQATTGNYCTQGTQDVIAYYPGAFNATTNPNGGGGAIACGTGTTQPLITPASGNGYTINQNSFSYTPDNGTTYENATVIANGGSENDTDFGQTTPLSYGIVQTGTGTTPTYALAVFAMTAPGTIYNVGHPLLLSSLTTPTGGTDWNNWTITTSQDTRAGTTYTDMYLWDSSTGDLYLWTGLAINNASYDKATGITQTGDFPIASGWNTGKTLTLRAADVAGDGNPGLWATDTTTGITTAYIPTTATITANPAFPSSLPQTKITTAGHSWPFNDMPGTANSGDAITTTADTAGGLTLTQPTGVSGATWNTGDLYSPDAAFDGTGGYLTTSSNPLDLTGSITLSFWAKPQTATGTVLTQLGSPHPGLSISLTASGWQFYLAKDNGTTSGDGDTITGGAIDPAVWTHIQATYATGVMSLYVDDTLVATGTHAAPTTGATGSLILGGSAISGTKATSPYTGQIADVEAWSGTSLAPNQPTTPGAYHQSVNPERILDTRASGNNQYSGMAQTTAPVGAHSTLTVPIAGDTITPSATGTQTTIPASVTAVALDITAISETANGYLVAYPDGTQVPVTSATNYFSNTTVTGYEIVPVGSDGKIKVYNSSTGTTHLLLDITAFYTTDATVTGDQTYHHLDSAWRVLNTGTGSGPVAAGGSVTVTITGVDNIPTTGVAAVALNLTAYSDTGLGDLIAYAAGTARPTATQLTYTGSGQIASLDADIPLGTGTNAGKITIYNQGASTTNIDADIAGYFTTGTTGQVYHTVNPTRLLDTRIGIGGISSPLAAKNTNALSGSVTAQITTATTPTLALMLTATNETANGVLVVYPGTTDPGTSNLNWSANQNIANLALVPTAPDGSVTFKNEGTSGSTDLIIDCSGYFATY